MGGILGNFLGPRLSEDFKEKLTTVFGSCALLMGVISITFMKNLPAVVFAVIAGTIVGLGIRLGDRIVQGSRNLEKLISRVLPASSGDSLIPREEYESRLITIIVLFCASGTGIYGSMVSKKRNHNYHLPLSCLFYPLPLALFHILLWPYCCKRHWKTV